MKNAPDTEASLLTEDRAVGAVADRWLGAARQVSEGKCPCNYRDDKTQDPKDRYEMRTGRSKKTVEFPWEEEFREPLLLRYSKSAETAVVFGNGLVDRL